MTENTVSPSGSRNDGASLVEQYREARGALSVLKMALAQLRAYSSKCLVFACEGVDDKKVYFHWIKVVEPSLNYEFLVCNGKEKVLKFREFLHRDLSGLNRAVYFIVDKDFDGLRGYAAGNDIYMTETYSFENHLISSEVLESVLTVDMHCHAAPDLRSNVLAKFDEMYQSFLAVTRPHNHRLFLARLLGISIRPLPTKLSKLATVDLLNVTGRPGNVEDIIVLDREPDAAEVSQSGVEFNKLDPRAGFRGKFAMLFFCRWLELLAEDRNSEGSKLFQAAPKTTARANGQLSIDSIASRSSPPAAFQQFIRSVSADALRPLV